ncbi:MAG: sugar phosphate isomerase/epimerase [Acidobacteriota bacterium]|nr:sugar phosphate isomerase/epimerase [Acidobacteriota bacterium]
MPPLTRRELLIAAALAPLAAAPLSDIKLGVTTDEIDEDLLTAVRFLKSFGLKYAEIRSIWGKYNTAQPLDKIREARKICDEYGIHVSIEGTAFFKVPLPPDHKALDEQWALLDASIERAKTFGTGKIRVFAFTTNQPGEKKDYARIYELVREAAQRARKAGLRLALENVGGSYVATGAQAAELLKNVKEDNLGLTWDPNNAAASGERPFPDGYRLLDPARIFHVHLRDFRHLPSGKMEWTAVGEGEFDNLGQIRALRKDGYQETFTLETHWRSPKGKVFATSTSLKALLQVIQGI